MFKNIKNITQTAFAFLRSDKAPPNITNPEQIQRLRNLNHLESSKFYIVFTSVVILAFFYFSTIGLLFLIPSAPPEYITGFVTIFSKTIEILAIIIASYVGAEMVVDLKYGSTSNASSKGTTESINEVTVIDTNAKEDDYEL
jgi:hypothetical protein